MAGDARRLLDHIIRTRLHRVELWQAELDATAENSDTLLDSVQRIEQRQREAARTLAGPFATGLGRAARHLAAPLVLDDRQPEENTIADAMILFLVKAGLATVTSDSVGAGHYRYQVMIDWPAIDAVAREAGVSLEKVQAR